MLLHRIKFKYADKISHYEWCDQECQIYGRGKGDAIRRCKELYGLGIDCEYEIISIEEI